MYVSSAIFRKESFTILKKNEFPLRPPLENSREF